VSKEIHRDAQGSTSLLRLATITRTAVEQDDLADLAELGFVTDTEGSSEVVPDADYSEFPITWK
jgi:hypothetical protein